MMSLYHASNGSSGGGLKHCNSYSRSSFKAGKTPSTSVRSSSHYLICPHHSRQVLENRRHLRPSRDIGLCHVISDSKVKFGSSGSASDNGVVHTINRIKAAPGNHEQNCVIPRRKGHTVMGADTDKHRAVYSGLSRTSMPSAQNAMQPTTSQHNKKHTTYLDRSAPVVNVHEKGGGNNGCKSVLATASHAAEHVPVADRRSVTETRQIAFVRGPETGSRTQETHGCSEKAPSCKHAEPTLHRLGRSKSATSLRVRCCPPRGQNHQQASLLQPGQQQVHCARTGRVGKAIDNSTSPAKRTTSNSRPWNVGTQNAANPKRAYFSNCPLANTCSGRSISSNIKQIRLPSSLPGKVFPTSASTPILPVTRTQCPGASFGAKKSTVAEAALAKKRSPNGIRTTSATAVAGQQRFSHSSAAETQQKLNLATAAARRLAVIPRLQLDPLPLETPHSSSCIIPIPGTSPATPVPLLITCTRRSSGTSRTACSAGAASSARTACSGAFAGVAVDERYQQLKLKALRQQRELQRFQQQLTGTRQHQQQVATLQQLQQQLLQQRMETDGDPTPAGAVPSLLGHNTSSDVATIDTLSHDRIPVTSDSYENVSQQRLDSTREPTTTAKSDRLGRNSLPLKGHVTTKEHETDASHTPPQASIKYSDGSAEIPSASASANLTFPVRSPTARCHITPRAHPDTAQGLKSCSHPVYRQGMSTTPLNNRDTGEAISSLSSTLVSQRFHWVSDETRAAPTTAVSPTRHKTAEESRVADSRTGFVRQEHSAASGMRRGEVAAQSLSLGRSTAALDEMTAYMGSAPSYDRQQLHLMHFPERRRNLLLMPFKHTDQAEDSRESPARETDNSASSSEAGRESVNRGTPVYSMVPTGWAWAKLHHMTEEMHRIHGWGPQYDVTAQQKLSELLAAAAVCAICSSNAFPALTQLGVTLSCVRASYEATLEALQKEPFRPSTDICRTTETAAILARTAEVAVNTEEVSASPGSGLVGGLILKTTHLTQPQSQGDTQNNCLTSITKTRSTAQAPRGTDEIPHRENQGSGLPVGSGNADGDPRIQRTLPSNHVRETVSSRCGCCPLESRSELLSSLVAARPDAASAVLEKNENSGTSDDWSAVVQAEPAPQRTLTPSSERITCRQRNTPRNRPPLCYPGFGDSEEVHTVKSVDGPAEDAIISVEKHDCGFNQCADNQRRYQTAACPTTPSLIPAPSASNTALSFRGNRCPHEKSPLRRLPLGESRSSITRQDVDEDASRCHIVPSRRASSRQESKEGIEAVSLKMNTTSHQTISYCSHHNSANDEGSSLLTHDCHRGCYDKDTTKGFCLATGISSPKLGVSGSSTAVPYNVLTATSTESNMWESDKRSLGSLELLERVIREQQSPREFPSLEGSHSRMAKKHSGQRHRVSSACSSQASPCPNISSRREDEPERPESTWSDNSKCASVSQRISPRPLRRPPIVPRLDLRELSQPLDESDEDRFCETEEDVVFLACPAG